ncbi:MAG: hypothetical protein CMK74_14035 [Pseudomonadales bacterium]|nr:hypothetical protein [Pseudomonadales bacterium]|tara:strand:+ start:1001 stop:1318 length:318 start_codon:yes stop_codon:yes gene_type:complete
MKLYVLDPSTGKKVFIKMYARNKHELKEKLRSEFLSVQGKKYSIAEVRAESGSSEPILGGVVGGLLGSFGGGVGVVLGGLIGSAVAAAQSDKEKKEVEVFNGSEM